MRENKGGATMTQRTKKEILKEHNYVNADYFNNHLIPPQLIEILIDIRDNIEDLTLELNSLKKDLR